MFLYEHMNGFTNRFIIEGFCKNTYESIHIQSFSKMVLLKLYIFAKSNFVIDPSPFKKKDESIHKLIQVQKLSLINRFSNQFVHDHF